MTNRLSRVKLFIIVAIFLAGSLLLAPQPAQAIVSTFNCGTAPYDTDPCTLGDLFDNLDASITVDDVSFFDFTLIHSSFDPNTDELPNPDPTKPVWGNVVVEGLSDPSNPGLKYVSNGEFRTLAPHKFSTYFFEFSFEAKLVDSNDPKIKDTSVAGTAELFGDISAATDIGVYHNINTGLATVGVSRFNFNPPDTIFPLNPDPIAEASFAPQPSISVDTTVFIDDDSNDDFAIELVWFTQRFSQVSTAPEPATLFLLGGGLAALGWMRRRRNG